MVDIYFNLDKTFVFFKFSVINSLKEFNIFMLGNFFNLTMNSDKVIFILFHFKKIFELN